jgi:hypothetical protein
MRVAHTLLLLVCLIPWPSQAAEQPLTEAATKAIDLLSPVAVVRKASLDYFVARGGRDAVPALILALRFSQDGTALASALETLTGEKPGPEVNSPWRLWSHWMLWQEAHPDVVPFAGFDAYQVDVFRRIDDNFGLFLKPGLAHEIRLEEIAWGGVVKDGIPALTNPKLVPADAAPYLTPNELVFGVAINGDVRAYPLRIMDWHEMLNDVIGGVPVSLAYCTLCGSGILFETTIEGRAEPFVFGSSGFLYRSNKLMYDQATLSLWNQFTGRPVVGPLTGSGIELKARPVVITTWSSWRADHPGTRVLDIETGFVRDYRPGRPYGAYFDSPELMFPTTVDETKMPQKDHVFALRGVGIEQAWPLARFIGGAVINDRAGVVDLTLIGDASMGTVRAYRTDGRTFEKGASLGKPRSDGSEWTADEDALVGPKGERFERLPGHVAYWFAWSGYFGKTGKLSTPPK